MKIPNLHMPHLHAGPRGEHHASPLKRIRAMENIMDYAVVIGGALLAIAMVYGLVTASGDVPWVQ